MQSFRERRAFNATTLAFSTDYKRVSFTLEEFILLRTMHLGNLLTDVQDLPSVLDMYVDHMSLYRDKKEYLQGLGEIVDYSKKGRTQILFKGAAAKRAQVIGLELDELLVNLWSRTFDDLRRTNNLMFDLQKAFLGRFGRSIMRIEFSVKRMVEAPPVDRRRRGVPQS